MTMEDKKKLETLRHSTSHVLAEAVKELYPGVKLGIGPAIEDGFYYDFDYKESFTPDDLKKIEHRMKEIIRKKQNFEKVSLSEKEAKELLKHEPYKLELMKELEDKPTFYKSGEFIDLCKGPHIESTEEIKAFKLTKVAGAYWKGDSENKQLQRIYGTAFFSEKELKDYLHFIEEAEKRDHRKLGKDLDLIYFHEYAPGSPFFLKKGAILYNQLIDFIRIEYKKRGYEEVITPQIYNKKLWEMSGHWDHYKDNMFITIVEGQEHSLKPMNCPSHCIIFNRDPKSYKDLPVRIADFCFLHRNEFSGTLSGLMRVRKFAQDDGHIFCRFDQIEDEVFGVLDFIKYVWTNIFNFKLEYYLSTKPEHCLGTKETWDEAEAILKKALNKANIPFSIKEGEGAFYGPKIDIDIEDALGRKWQCPTCQLDFNLPDRFSTTYMDAEGKKQNAVMIHRAVLGSLERFIGLLIEHYAGKFPLWLSPVQVRILTVADRFNEYAETVAKKYIDAGIRVEVDSRTESISKKVREAQLDKVNYILVVGEKEIAEETVTVRTRDNQVIGASKVGDFLGQLLEEVKNKK
jgi:threonyl-tRNA synthetase